MSGPILWMALPALAQTPPAAFTVGISDVRITAGNGFQQLRFGDQALAEGDAIVPLGELRAGGDAALVFSVRQRGSACTGGITVVTARSGEAARFDRRLIDECNGLSLARSSDRLLLVAAPSPAYQGSLWQVTPRDGLRLIGPVAFAPEPGSDFAALKPDDPTLDAPIAMLRNQSVWTGFVAATGADFKAYAASLSIADKPLARSSPLLAAAGCSAADECKRSAGLLIVDPIKRAVYVARRQAGKVAAKPELKGWPEAARALLAAWEARSTQ